MRIFAQNGELDVVCGDWRILKWFQRKVQQRKLFQEECNSYRVQNVFGKIVIA